MSNILSSTMVTMCTAGLVPISNLMGVAFGKAGVIAFETLVALQVVMVQMRVIGGNWASWQVVVAVEHWLVAVVGVQLTVGWWLPIG